MRYPRRLYQTPEGWGRETYWVSARELRRMVADLRRSDPGGQFAEVSVKDALPWTLVGGDGWYECQVGRVKYMARFRWSKDVGCWLPIEPVEVFELKGGAWVKARS